MDKQRTHHAAVVRRVISESPYYVHGSKGPDVETLFTADDESGTYHLFDLGWRGKDRVYNTFLLIRLKDGKIHIEEDWTEDGIAADLLDAGVPREEIVLAFHYPPMRKYTEFAAV